MSATYYEEEGVTVTISDEGLRRLKNDNDLLKATARTHEIMAAAGCAGIVVAIVMYAVHVLSGG